MIESRDIPDLLFERLPVFSASWHLYYPGGDAGRRARAFPLMVAVGIYATRLAASRDEASLDRVLRFVEEVHEEGSSGAVGLVTTHFLEVFAGGLNDLGVDWAQIEGPRWPEDCRVRALARDDGLLGDDRPPSRPFGLAALGPAR